MIVISTPGGYEGRHRAQRRRRFLSHLAGGASTAVVVAALAVWSISAADTSQASSGPLRPSYAPTASVPSGPLVLVDGRLVPVLDHLNTTEDR